jgi:hypothetical protein
LPLVAYLSLTYCYLYFEKQGLDANTGQKAEVFCAEIRRGIQMHLGFQVVNPVVAACRCKLVI